MNIFDILLILIFIFLIISFIYKNCFTEHLSINENIDSDKSNTSDTDTSDTDTSDKYIKKIDNNEISCCDSKEKDNMEFINRNISKIKDMFDFFDHYKINIKDMTEYINKHKDDIDFVDKNQTKLTKSIEVTDEIISQYNKEQTK